MKNILFFFSLLFVGATSMAATEGHDVKLFYDANGNLYNGKYYTYHENGKVATDFNIKEGKIAGEAKFFYESGELLESGEYVNGLKNGVWTKVSKDGKVLGTASFKDGDKDGEWFIYDNQGHKLFEMHYTKGKRSGTWKQWDADGNLISTKEY